MTNIFENGGEFCTRGDFEKWQKDPTFVPRSVEWHWFKTHGLTFPVSYVADTETGNREVTLRGEYIIERPSTSDLVPLPKPPQLVPWSGPQDVPDNCWIRNKSTRDVMWVTRFCDGLPMLVGKPTTYAQLLRDYEWSTSHSAKDWQPCGKLSPQP